MLEVRDLWPLYNFYFSYVQRAGVPKLFHAIEEYLSLPDEKTKNPLDYFLTTEDFEKWVAEEVASR